jgi:hypothetical protein
MHLVFEPEEDQDAGAATGPALADFRMLVASAEAEDRLALSDCAADAGMQVIQAVDAGSAWFQTMAYRPDVVVVDALLPGGGHAFASRLAHQVTPGPLVVLLAAGSVGPDAERELREQCGATLVLPRPCSAHEVMARVGAMLDGPGGAQPLTPHARGPMPSQPPPPFSGANHLAAQAALVAFIYGEHRSGVLRVECPGVTRELLFQDGLLVATSSNLEDERLGAWLRGQGLITHEQLVTAQKHTERHGGRLGFALVQQCSVPPTRVAQAILDQMWWVAMHAVAAQSGQHTFVPATQNLVLATQIPLDPLEALQRACLDVVSDSDARAILSRRQGVLRWNPTAGDRMATLGAGAPARMASFCPPGAALETILRMHPPTPSALRELLAMLLTGAMDLDEPDKPRPSPRMRPVHATSDVAWQAADAHLGAEGPDAMLRSALAVEWLRTGGAQPHEVLEVIPGAPVEAVRTAAVAKLRLVAGPVVMQANLGGAQRLLEVLRARVAESARLMGRGAGSPHASAPHHGHPGTAGPSHHGPEAGPGGVGPTHS